MYNTVFSAETEYIHEYMYEYRYIGGTVMMIASGGAAVAAISAAVPP